MVVGGLLAAAALAEPPNARSDAQLVEYIQTLSLWAAGSAPSLQRLQAAGIDETLVAAWLSQLQAACLEQPDRCGTIGAGASPTGAVTDQLIDLLAAMGTAQSVSLLERLAERRAFHASIALKAIAGRSAARGHRVPCTPPSDEEVRQVEQRLAGFPVLSHQREQLAARIPTHAEASDLAYFLVATAQTEPRRPQAPRDAGLSESGRCGFGLDPDGATKDFIVNAEVRGRCRAAVKARLLRVPADGPLGEVRPDLYGTEPLMRDGFDVERLYRGALLSVNHSIPDERLREAVSRAPPEQLALMQAHLASWGHPDWEFETLAIEGWANAMGRAAFPRLLDFASSGVPPVRIRALNAIEYLVEENSECEVAACDGRGTRFAIGRSQAGSVKALAANCADALSQAERSELTKALLPLSNGASQAFLEAFAQTIGALGTPAAREVLRELAQDPKVQRAATDALSQVDAALAARACEQRFVSAHPDLAGGRFILPASQRTGVSRPLEGLMDPEHRSEVFCELVASGKHRKGSVPHGIADACEVNHVLVAPQEHGSPAVVVFTAASWAKLSGPGKPKGPFVVFDAEGYQLPVAHNANVLDAESDAFSYRGDALLAVGLTVRWETGKTLYVVPVGPSTLPVLSVELSEPDWSWRIASDGPKRPPRIEVGREVDLARNAPAGTYRWVTARSRYEGPTGGPKKGFRRVRDEASTCEALDCEEQCR